MKYPDDFDSPAFPAGKPVAISRFMAIAMSVAVLLILFVCVLVVWGSKSQSIHPFLVSTNPVTGEWKVVGHEHDGQRTISRSRALQESVLNRTFKNIFTISNNAETRSELWQKCNREDCAKRFLGDTKYSIYCSVSDEQFDSLVSSVNIQNQQRFESGERWNIIDLEMIPGVGVDDQGGLWTIHARINSNITGIFNVIAYARMASNTQIYPHTMGFFVDTINAYKISK